MVSTLRLMLAKSAAAVLVVGGLAVPAQAQSQPSLNLSGVTGLIDMPSGEAQPDGYLSFAYGKMGGIGRNTLSFQLTPRLSGSFRYVGIQRWNDRFCPPDCSGVNGFNVYYDRSFDLRYKVLEETRYLPAVTIGLQDFIGTSLSMGEYVVATKSFGPRLKVTAGLGFGRLGSYNSIGTIFGKRDRVDFGNGGLPNYDQWFRGDAALFGGIEYQLADKWTIKAEYSSDAYVTEARRREVFTRATPFNFGIEYQYSNAIRLGLYSMYGDTIGFNVSANLNPALRPQGGVRGVGPVPVLPRPSISDNPNLWTTAWLVQTDSRQGLIDAMNAKLVRTGLRVEELSLAGDTAQVGFRNTIYDASAQAVGRIARAMTHAMPASVETFEIVPMVNGMRAAKVVVRRSDMEALEFVPDSGAAMRARVAISEAGAPLGPVTRPAGVYPRFSWSLAPNAQTMLFNPNQPFQVIVGARLSGTFEISPGFFLSASVNKRLGGDVISGRNGVGSKVPPVRSDADIYFDRGDPSVTVLTAAWYGKLAPEVYSRVTVGYLEQMFGGISAEVLWKPIDRRWALGAEFNYVAQRDNDGGYGFDTYDYRVASGFVTGYVDLGKGFEAQVDVGRYLAGDVGATFTLMRTFANGWKIGAFATFTDLSSKEFGEGSFDKGIKMEIPLSWFTGHTTRTSLPFTLRPLGRDGGAQLYVDDRLMQTLRSYDTRHYEAQAGRFWK
jgi:opacity protein-like surface antigen